MLQHGWTWELFVKWSKPFTKRLHYKGTLSHQLHGVEEQLLGVGGGKSSSVQFSHSACLTIFHRIHCRTPGLPVHHQLLELAQTHVHCVSDAIQPSHPCPLLLPPSIFPSISVFSNESVLHNQVAQVLELQLQHQSFQWIFRTDFL